MVDNLVGQATELESLNSKLNNRPAGKPFVADTLARMKAWRLANGASWLAERSESDGDKNSFLSVAFIPTMGALHDGHIELVRRARAEADLVVVSIFVNPFQFAPHEDFDKYPRTFNSDLELLNSVGVDCIFCPSEKEIYPHGRQSIVSVVPASPLNDTLEGAFRPTFFKGVATVVTKLFNLVQPHMSFFGEKDFQQLLVIKALACDLNLPVAIVGVPTVREPDGLAMSSRNAYLDSTSRALAPVLHQALSSVVSAFESKVPAAAALEKAQALIKAESKFDLQYLSLCHAETLEPLSEFAKPFVVLLAAKLGDVRLIDNIVVT
mgnify:CR=1 FL=1